MEQEVVIADRDVPKDVHRAIAEGRKIVAIKLLREETGLGLANAKVIVDRLAAKHARNKPTGQGIKEVSNSRRLLAMLVLIAAAFAAWRFGLPYLS